MKAMKIGLCLRRHTFVSVAASLALLTGAAGCTERDVASVENGLWKMFAGHPKPIVLNKVDPRYATIGEPQCYAEPLESERSMPIQ